MVVVFTVVVAEDFMGAAVDFQAAVDTTGVASPAGAIVAEDIAEAVFQVAGTAAGALVLVRAVSAEHAVTTVACVAEILPIAPGLPKDAAFAILLPDGTRSSEVRTRAA